jgi:DNA-binding beta-propeller fold protein YncE
VIDTATNTVVATVPVGNSPIGVAITRDGTRAYVVNDLSNTASVIDTATNTVTCTRPSSGAL